MEYILCFLIIISSYCFFMEIPNLIPRTINLFLAIIFCIAILSSCTSISQKDLDKNKTYTGEDGKKETEITKAEARKATETIDNSAGIIIKNAESTIKTETLSDLGKDLQEEIATEGKLIQTKIPELNRSVEELAGILRAELDKMKKYNELVIKESERQLKDFNEVMEKSAEEKEELLKQLKEKDEQIEAIHKSMLYKILAGFILLFISGVGIGIWINIKTGIGVSATGLVGAALTLFLIKYLGPISIILGIIVLIGLVIGIIYIVKQKKISTELIKSFDYQKSRPWEPENKEIINLIQSSDTKKLVEELKKEI